MVLFWILLSRSSKTYQYHIICPSRYSWTFCIIGNVLVDYDFSRLGDEILNFTIFPAFNVIPVKGYDTISVTFKDVRAHCYCASLVRALFIRHARATPFSSSCTELNTQQNIELTTFVLTWCANIFVGCSVTPTFFRQITSFSDSFHYTKKRKKSVHGKF